jgi:hypothetical protein
MNFNNYQKNPVKLKNSVKYDYRYKYCPPYIKGVNNTYQYYKPENSCYFLLKDDPYLRKLPDSLSKGNINCLSERSKIIYSNSDDKNWGPQTINRKFWDQQNKVYESNDLLLRDKIDKIKYEENKRNNKHLKNSNPKFLNNGYYNWGSKNENWFYPNKSKNYKKNMFGNMGINTYSYIGNTYRINVPNINTDPLYYSTHYTNYGGNVLNNWYKWKPNYINTGRSIYDLGITRKY